MNGKIIDAVWLARPSAEVAPELIGCFLVRRLQDGRVLRGMIVEVEAYSGAEPGSHAFRGKTIRNAALFGPPGRAYVYFIYGMHHCCNVVTDQDGVAGGVLLRALFFEPGSGPALEPGEDPIRVASGPGKICKVMGIDRNFNSVPFGVASTLWLEHRESGFSPKLVQTTRVGLAKGKEIPWRWFLDGCRSVSRGPKS